MESYINKSRYCYMKNRIRELRKEHGLTLQELSSLVGLGVSTLSGYEKEKGEKGFRNPKIENWQKLADYFGVTVGYLQGKGVTPDEMLNFIVDMFSINRTVINPVNKARIDKREIYYLLQIYLDIDAIKKISTAIPLEDHYANIKYTYTPIVNKYALEEIFRNNRHIFRRGDFDNFQKIFNENKRVKNIVRESLRKNVTFLKDYKFLCDFEMPFRDEKRKKEAQLLELENPNAVSMVYEKLVSDLGNGKSKDDIEAQVVLYEKNISSEEKSNYGFSIWKLNDTVYNFSNDIKEYRDKIISLRENGLDEITKLRELSTDIESMITYLKNYQDSVQQYLNKQENSEKD